MATYVLVGGAWMGAWVWGNVTRRLRDLGHTVSPATLTGLGDRVHLATPDINLNTHITDVLNLIAYEDLADVFLVGHSYAGCVVTGVADRAAEKIGALIYCDSAPLADGMSMLDQGSPAGRAAVEERVQREGHGWLIPFPGVDGLDASTRGIDAAGRALMERKATPQPFATWTTPLRLERTGPAPYRKAVVVCDDGREMLQFARANPERVPALAEVANGHGWELHDLDTGHWPMLSTPAKLADLLSTLAREKNTPSP